MSYNPNYDRYNNSGGQQQQKKRSGAKESTIGKGKSQGMIAVTAWNYSKKRGLITVKAFQNKKSTKSKSDKGNRFVSLIFEVFYHRTGNTIICPAPYNVDSGKAYLDKLNMVISTKARNGGYFGRV